MEKELAYLLSLEAHEGLANLFSIASSSTVTRQHYRDNNNAIYDGYQVVVFTGEIVHSSEGVSHNLNLLASYYDLTDWTDNRTPEQLLQTIISPRPVFHTIKEAHDYKELNGGYPDELVTWANTPLYEWVYDESLERDVRQYCRRQYRYRLSNGARQYYEALANMYHMRPPTRGRMTQTGKVAAALEAIGIKWLEPPEDYITLIAESPNKNKARPNRKSRSSFKATGGNKLGTPFTPDPDKYKPFTNQSIMALRQQMIANGEIVEE